MPFDHQYPYQQDIAPVINRLAAPAGDSLLLRELVDEIKGLRMDLKIMEEKRDPLYQRILREIRK